MDRAVKDPSEWIIKYIKDSDEAIKKLSTIDIPITKHDIRNALVEVLELDCATELMYEELSVARILELLSSFDFSQYYPEIACEVTLEESIVPSYISALLTEQTIRTKGEVWRIHKNDVDPFPSNPHAHNYPANLVAHLGNGDLYRKKKILGRLKKKDLVNLRGLIKNGGLPDLEV